MVMSPGLGVGLVSGVYCLMDRWRTSSWVVEVEREKPRMWDASSLCWSMRKCFEDMLRLGKEDA